MILTEFLGSVGGTDQRHARKSWTMAKLQVNKGESSRENT